ncbi:hypothetical protein FRC18_012107 [Serendipita sp. 400]|nr:hypothetical protein FRC18_012107 [Serendipita sp. 400]
MPHLPAAKRGHATELLLGGKSVWAIASTLEISIGAISNIHSSLVSAPTGQPAKLTLHDQQYIHQLILSGKYKDAADLHKNTTFNISCQTIWNALHWQGLVGHVKVKKPLFKQRHQLACLAFISKIQGV